MSILSEFYKSIEATTGKSLSSSQRMCANQIGDTVEQFIVSNGLGRTVNNSRFITTEALAGYDTSMFASQVGFSAVEDLVRACNIDRSETQAAMESVCNVIQTIAGANGSHSAVWNRQGSVIPKTDRSGAQQSLESYMPANMANILNSEPSPCATLESFGVDNDRAVPDLKISLTVALMRFHRSILGNLIPNRGTDSPSIMYKKPTVLVSELDNPDATPKPFIDMYRNASMISNQLKRIEPIYNAATNANLLVANGIIKNKVQINILQQSINANKYGYTKINYTDLVSEGVRMDKIYVRLNTSGSNSSSGSTSALDVFCIEVPQYTGRLTHTTNNRETSQRQLFTQFDTVLNATSKGVNTAYASSDATTVLSGIDDGESLILKLHIAADVTLRNGDTFANISGTVEGYNSVGNGTLSATLQSIVSDINNAGGVEIIGYVLDARYSEENMRKSNIVLRTVYQSFEYNIPTGRNFIYDWSLNTPQEEIASQLADFIAVGMDDRALNIFQENQKMVHAELAAEAAAPTKVAKRVADDFVTGSIVYPYVWQGTLDISKIQSIRSADRPGDIAQYAQTFLTRVMERILTNSFYNHQLGPNTAPEFNLYTSLDILSNILGQPQIHTALDKREADSISKVPYRIVLQNGVILNCFWHTFDMVQNFIRIIPKVNGDDTSYLNYGHNWDYGTVVGQFTQTGDAVFNRIYANSRELPIVTTPIAAVIEVTGIPAVTGVTAGDETLPTYTGLVYNKLV